MISTLGSWQICHEIVCKQTLILSLHGWREQVRQQLRQHPCLTSASLFAVVEDSENFGPFRKFESMAKSKAVTAPSQETRDYVFQQIQQTSEPVTAGQVAKLLAPPHKLSEAKVTPILDEFVAAERLQTFPPKTAKGKPRYWDRDQNEFARSLILETLDKKGSLAKTDLRKAVKQLTEELFLNAFQGLLDAQKLFEHPPLPKKKTSLFGNRPPAPEPYLNDLGVQLSKIVGQLKGASVPDEVLRRALVQLVESTGVPFGGGAVALQNVEMPSEELKVDLIALMRSIEPAADSGALVAARELRRAAKLEKMLFDQEILGLARQGRLMLHRHDFAGGLSPAERDELVTDGAGTYYVGMALRRESAQ